MLAVHSRWDTEHEVNTEHIALGLICIARSEDGFFCAGVNENETCRYHLGESVLPEYYREFF